MKSSKGNASGFNPMVYSVKLGRSIPYHESLKKSEKILEKSEKKGPGLLERIRSLQFGKAGFSSNKPVKPLNENIKEQPESAGTFHGPVKQNRSKTAIKKEIKDNRNVFLEDFSKACIDFSGEEIDVDELDRDDKGNVCLANLSFDENMARIRQEFLGEKIEKIDLVKDKNGNVSLNEFSFEQKLDAVKSELLGEGSGPGELIIDSVTDPKKSILENLDAIMEAFPNVSARKGWSIAPDKNPKNKKQIKGIHR